MFTGSLLPVVVIFFLLVPVVEARTLGMNPGLDLLDGTGNGSESVPYGPGFDFTTLDDLCNTLSFHTVPGPWELGRASSYQFDREQEGKSSMQPPGACGYGPPEKTIYGPNYVAVPSSVLKAGEACGKCMEVACLSAYPACRDGAVKVTVVDVSLNKPRDEATFDGLRRTPHIVLSLRTFGTLVIPGQRIEKTLPIRFRWIPCLPLPFVVLRLTGNRGGGWLSMVVQNVPGRGRIAAVQIKDAGYGVDEAKWEFLGHYFGAVYQRVGRPLLGPISIRVYHLSGMCKLEATDCINFDLELANQFADVERHCVYTVHDGLSP